MTRLVLDASVVVKWFSRERESNLEIAGRLRNDFESASLDLIAPPIMFLEILNTAGRRWRRAADELRAVAVALDGAGFAVITPSLVGVADWTARGLSAYDASYVALAEEQGVTLITADEKIVAIAPGVASLLSAY